MPESIGIDSSRGSVWRKWDLHVHTPASAIAHNFGDNWDVYVEKLIDAASNHEISALATADYFSIGGYRELVPRYYNPKTRTLSVNGKSVILTILPGVELRLNIFNSEEDSINMHVLFDPDLCSPDFIDEHFLEELKIGYRGAEYSLRTQALLAIGKSIANGTQIAPGENFGSLPVNERKNFLKRALGTITLAKRDINEALKEIDDIFERQKLPPKAYLVALVGKGHGGIRTLKWFEENKRETFSRAGLVREDLTHQADIIFSNDPDDRNFYLGKSTATPERQIRERFRKLKPCVWGSDSHDLNHLLHPSNGNSLDYTWIKGELTFEGLKQISFEPELRVRVQREDPSEAETYTKIEKCIIDFPDDLKISTEAITFCLSGKYEIGFSNNLSCIVGGRGSGKSTLVHILYNSWHYRDAGKLGELNSPLTNLKLPSKDTLGKVRDIVTVDIPVNTEFYLQNEIEKFAKDIQEMSKLIRHRLERISIMQDSANSLEKLESEWKVTSANVDELITAYNGITDMEAKVEEIKRQITTLKKQTDVIKSEEYKALQKEIEQIANSMSDFESYEREYKKVVSDLALLAKSIGKLDWRKRGSQDVLDGIKTDLGVRQEQLTKVFSTARTAYDDQDYPKRLSGRKDELKKYLREKGLSPENIGELADATQQVSSLEARILELQSEAAPHREIYAQRAERLNDYKGKYEQYRTRLFTVSNELQSSLSGLKFAEQQTEITFHPRTNEQPIKDAAVNFIKTHNKSKTILSTDSIQSVLFENNIPIEDLVADKQKLVETVSSSQKATAHTQVLQELLRDEVFLEKLCLEMQRSYFHISNIQVQTKLGAKLLQSTSFGERCGIVIAIVLVAGTNPIVVDQPEDNLDGKFISNVLVPLIRKQKQNRQIILVTRDANIAIGGDAELISILEGSDTGKTRVLSATIENKEARAKYIWILDGGEKAFQIREEKYNLP